MTTMTGTRQDTPSVWIGCLACYNDGRLNGKWVDGEDALDLTPEGLHGFPTNHEELWVMDHENYGGLLKGECSPSEAQELAETVARVQKAGYPIEAYATYLDFISDADNDTFNRFTEAYCGHWDSRSDFAADLADSLGSIKDDLGWPYTYIDWDHAADELFNGDYWEDSGYIFHST